MSQTGAALKEIEELKEVNATVRSDVEKSVEPIKVIPINRKQMTGEGDFWKNQQEIINVTEKSQSDFYIEAPAKPNQTYLMVMREHFVIPILNALQSIEPYATTSDAAPYVNEVLHNIQELGKKSPLDPFLEILSGLYIALVFDNQWANYEPIQYRNLLQILKKFANRTSLKTPDIEKAIMAMEEEGFDTTPIPISSESEV